ncbi:hypothetical protein HDV05_000441 [Chytridiales sp. JEL 0842]|nr:hypothetical protein HDV05_000441 [Chytridiales sp. JEL 0842]
MSNFPAVAAASASTTSSANDDDETESPLFSKHLPYRRYTPEENDVFSNLVKKLDPNFGSADLCKLCKEYNEQRPRGTPQRTVEAIKGKLRNTKKREKWNEKGNVTTAASSTSCGANSKRLSSKTSATLDLKPAKTETKTCRRTSAHRLSAPVPIQPNAVDEILRAIHQVNQKVSSLDQRMSRLEHGVPRVDPIDVQELDDGVIDEGREKISDMTLRAEPSVQSANPTCVKELAPKTSKEAVQQATHIATQPYIPSDEDEYALSVLVESLEHWNTRDKYKYMRPTQLNKRNSCRYSPAENNKVFLKLMDEMHPDFGNISLRKFTAAYNSKRPKGSPKRKLSSIRSKLFRSKTKQAASLENATASSLSMEAIVKPQTPDSELINADEAGQNPAPRYCELHAKCYYTTEENDLFADLVHEMQPAYDLTTLRSFQNAYNERRPPNTPRRTVDAMRYKLQKRKREKMSNPTEFSPTATALATNQSGLTPRGLSSLSARDRATLRNKLQKHQKQNVTLKAIATSRAQCKHGPKELSAVTAVEVSRKSKSETRMAGNLNKMEGFSENSGFVIIQNHGPAPTYSLEENALFLKLVVELHPTTSIEDMTRFTDIYNARRPKGSAARTIDGLKSKLRDLEATKASKTRAVNTSKVPIDSRSNKPTSKVCFGAPFKRRSIDNAETSNRRTRRSGPAEITWSRHHGVDFEALPDKSVISKGKRKSDTEKLSLNATLESQNAEMKAEHCKSKKRKTESNGFRKEDILSAIVKVEQKVTIMDQRMSRLENCKIPIVEPTRVECIPPTRPQHQATRSANEEDPQMKLLIPGENRKHVHNQQTHEQVLS